LGRDYYQSLAPEFFPLWETLLQRIQDASLVCPFSTYRRAESELTDRTFEREIYRTANQICGGVSFQDYAHIVQRQMNRALSSYFLGTESDVDWTEAFDKDPQDHTDEWEELAPSGGRFVNWTKRVREYHETRGDDPPVGNFNEQKAYEAAQLVESLYILPTANVLADRGNFFKYFMTEFLFSLLKQYNRLSEDPPSVGAGRQLAIFLKSSAAMSIPFIDIQSTLRAGMLLYAPQRRISGTDLQDVQAISALLPYSDLFACDSYMKDLITRTGLSEKYGAVVFGGRVRDTTALEQHIQNI
jgi:hypothetical protein